MPDSESAAEKSTREDGAELTEQAANEKTGAALTTETGDNEIDLTCYETMPANVPDPAIAPLNMSTVVPPGYRKDMATNEKSSQEDSTSTRDKAKRKRQDESDEEGEMLDVAGHFVYDWSSLRLGQDQGTAAWNKALRLHLCKNPHLKRVPLMTPIDTLHRIQQNQLETPVPHPSSSLHEVLKDPNWKVENYDKDIDPDLANLYRELVKQDLDPGYLSRSRIQLMKADAVVEKMQHFEYEAWKLKQEETELINNSSRLKKIFRSKHVCEEAENGTPVEQEYWAEDFDRILNEDPERSKYLADHDRY